MCAVAGTTSDSDSNIHYCHCRLVDANTCPDFDIYANGNIHTNDYFYSNNHTNIYDYRYTYFCLPRGNGQ